MGHGNKAVAWCRCENSANDTKCKAPGAIEHMKLLGRCGSCTWLFEGDDSMETSSLLYVCFPSKLQTAVCLQNPKLLEGHRFLVLVGKTTGLLFCQSVVWFPCKSWQPLYWPYPAALINTCCLRVSNLGGGHYVVFLNSTIMSIKSTAQRE